MNTTRASRELSAVHNVQTYEHVAGKVKLVDRPAVGTGGRGVTDPVMAGFPRVSPHRNLLYNTHERLGSFSPTCKVTSKLVLSSTIVSRSQNK